MKVVKTEVVFDEKDIEMMIEPDDEISLISIGKKSWTMDTSNLKRSCKDTLDIIKELEEVK